MNLTDPSRPRIGHKPALIGGTFVVPDLRIILNGTPETVELTAMLPVSGESSRFVAKEFRAEVKTEKLPELISMFHDDPEATLASLFGSDPTGFVPAVAVEPTSISWAREQRRHRERTDPESIRAVKASFAEEDD